jgi:[ribosomal protein S5]-alanine N-acetyltransferase
MLGPVIEGERLRLIPATEEMLPTFVKWMSDREVTRFLGRQEPPSLEQEKEWFKGVCSRDNVVFWVIALGDRIIGTSGIHDINWRNRRASTGSLIGEKEEWRKGYASEAHRLRTRYAFEELGLEKLQSSAVVENVGSIRALEKSGYRQYGIARRHEFRGGRWYDMWFGEVLREEWLATRSIDG